MGDGGWEIGWDVGEGVGWRLETGLSLPLRWSTRCARKMAMQVVRSVGCNLQKGQSARGSKVLPWVLWDRSMLEWPACRDSLPLSGQDSPGQAGQERQGIGDGASC